MTELPRVAAVTPKLPLFFFIEVRLPTESAPINISAYLSKNVGERGT